MDVKLGVFERLVLPSVLPTEGGAKRMRTIRKIQEKVDFDESERQMFDIRSDPATNNVVWSKEGARDKDLAFNATEAALIVSQLEALDKDEKLTTQTFPLFEKFIGNGEAT